MSGIAFRQITSCRSSSLRSLLNSARFNPARSPCPPLAPVVAAQISYSLQPRVSCQQIPVNRNAGIIVQAPCRGYAKKGKDGKGKHDKKHDKKNKPKVELVGEELNEVIDVPQMEHKLQASLDHLRLDFVEQLSLRTSVGILDSLQVQTPDGSFPLIQLGQVVKKNPQLFVIDMTGLPQYTAAARDAIANSGLNLNPQQDGTSIFVPIPPVTREYRENLAKNAKILCDKAKVKLRNIHNHYTKEINAAKKNQDASKELLKNLEDHVHFLMKQYSDKADEMMHQKQQELLNSK
ncbi:hypothetical protein CAPTEDRAFT_226887 [Capitella teleta]|uniref:Ribosome-recycling factor, mitochondrial n=1 Tax=Capitella teleta TaxID=283909 RepID=R7U9N1_CAPTE|nr:hypothetical protein CAPTEDRAFT_226887 [Capitella teleta]|eukprot:ELU02846.1 hypothetical protein CAPTEDRAFT_226887 [Capitella teleta]